MADNDDNSLKDGDTGQSFCSTSSSTIGQAGTISSLPDRYHHSFIAALSLIHQLRVDILDSTWQPSLGLLGSGGSSQISVSNLVTKRFAFAFKRTVPRRELSDAGRTTVDKARYRSLICEILVLTHPSTRHHPNINSLQGIAWEFYEGGVWPVLAFPEARHGNLGDFVRGKDGGEASLEVLIRICAGCGLGLDTLHRNGIVHGDIKPENILVFFKDGAYEAKLTDFESSSICDSDDDLVLLPMSAPWNAPEWHYRWFKLEDAKRTDIYSFGLVCLFVLFQPMLNMSIVEALPDMKSKSEIPAFVENALTALFDILPRQHECLSQFFGMTVSTEPGERELDLEKLLRLLIFDEDFVLVRSGEDNKAAFPDPHSLVSIASEFVHIGRCDYRVRLFLEKELMSAAEDAACPECGSQAALTLALGLGIGFFPGADEGTAQDYLRKSGISPDTFDHKVKQIRMDVNPQIRIGRTLNDYRALLDSVVVESYRKDGVLAQAEAHLAREVEARIRLLGQEHILTRDAKLQLASVLQATYQWNQATELLQQVIQSNQKLEISWDYGGAVRSLAVIIANQGKWDESERLLQGEIDKTMELLEEVRQGVERLMKTNKELKKKYGGTEHMPRVEMMGKELEELRDESGEANQVLLSLLHQMGAIYHGQGRYDLAVDTYQKVVDGSKKLLGDNHLSTISAMESLASSRVRQGALPDALQLAKVVTERLTRLKGANDRQTLHSEVLLAKIQFWLEDSAESVDRLKGVIQKQSDVLGASDWDTLEGEAALSRCHMDRGEWTSALGLQEALVEKSKTALGDRHPFTIRSRIKLGCILENLGHVDRAIDEISAGVRDHEAVCGEAHPQSISGHVAMSSAFLAKGRLKEAEELGERSLQRLQRLYGKDHDPVLAAMATLAATYSARSRADKASPLLQSAIEISTKTSGSKSRETLYLRSRYAAIVPPSEKADNPNVPCFPDREI